ncbi:hypothetical protein EVAR_93198_1 [Eumeta japonica]|uniref:Uncharacterized protein n=1 Tax=Eumeta variegata TaxID=151549 RepID=A0A4C1TXQ1_EUMVA|nr:hypothetical protein EVAR_93198_1 [Eumeta japonica]
MNSLSRVSAAAAGASRGVSVFVLDSFSRVSQSPGNDRALLGLYRVLSGNVTNSQNKSYLNSKMNIWTLSPHASTSRRLLRSVKADALTMSATGCLISKVRVDINQKNDMLKQRSAAAGAKADRETESEEPDELLERPLK